MEKQPLFGNLMFVYIPEFVLRALPKYLIPGAGHGLM